MTALLEIDDGNTFPAPADADACASNAAGKSNPINKPKLTFLISPSCFRKFFQL